MAPDSAATYSTSYTPSWDPAAAIDDNDDTCFHIPPGEASAYLLIDLGEVMDVDDILISTAHQNMFDFVAYVGDTIDAVTHDHLGYVGWGDGAAVGAGCNGGTHYSMVYDSTYKHHYKAPALFTVPCQVRCAFSDRGVRSRMPLDPTHARLKLLPMTFVSGVHCSYRCHHKSCRNTEGTW
jgi:hypothetical protein